MIEKVFGHPACLVDKKALVIADLHIGLEQELQHKGIRLKSLTKEMLDETLLLLKETGAKDLVLLGDVKHHIASTSRQEEREIPLFISEVSKLADVTVVLGNHDGGISHLLGDAKAYDARGFLFGDTLLFHGNAKPRMGDISDCKEMVASHWHPMFLFDKGVKEKAFFECRAFGKPLLIIPSFNRLLPGVPLQNVDTQWLDMRHVRAYTLDGVDLGVFDWSKS